MLLTGEIGLGTRVSIRDPPLLPPQIEIYDENAPGIVNLNSLLLKIQHSIPAIIPDSSHKHKVHILL